MAPTIKQRIELDGGKELNRELEEFGAAGRKAFKDLQAAAAATKGLPPGFFSSLKQAEVQIKSLAKSFEDAGKKIQSVGKTLSTNLTLPIVGIGTVVLKQAADFQTAMNSFAVNAGVAGTALEDAKTKAQELGQASVFSSTEAAQGMTELAKVGIDFQTIMQGAAKAMVDLAAANDTGLANSASIIGDVINQFKLSASQLPAIVDQITGATIESKLSIDDYRQAIGQAGGAAGALGVSFEDMNAVLAATASSFSSGSDAGTSFKTFLTRLVPQSKQAAAAMEKLGLKFFDANGKALTMSQTAQLLQEKLGKLSQEDLTDNVQNIFGTDAMRTAIALMKQGGAGIDSMLAKLKNTDSAEIAATRVKGLWGEIDQLKSALENLSIAIGKSGFLDFATNIVIKLTDWTQALTTLSPGMLELGTIIAGVVASVGPFLFGLGLLTRGFGITLQGLGTLIAGFRNLAAALLFIAGVPELAALTLIGVAIGVWATRTDQATAALQEHEKVVNDVDAAYQKVNGSLAKMTQEVKDRLLLEATDSLDKTKEALVGALSDLANKLPHFEGDLQNSAAQAMFDLAKQLQDGTISVDKFNEAIARIGAANVGNDVGKLATTWLEMTKQATELTAKTNEMADRVAWLSDKMSDQAFQAAQAARGIEGYVAANKNAAADTQALGNAADEAGKKVDGLSHTIQVFRGGGADGKVSSETLNVINGVVQAAEKSKTALDGVGTSAAAAGTKVKAVADDIASHIRTVPDSLTTNAITPAVDGIVTDIQRIKPAADEAATGLKAALNPADGEGGGLGSAIGTTVDGVITDLQKLPDAGQEAVGGLNSALSDIDTSGAQQAASAISDPFNKLPGIFSQILSGLGQLLQGGFGNLASTVSTLAGQVRREISSIISALQQAVAEAQRLRAQASSGGGSGGGGGSQGGFATGGYLANGPGTPTSDSIPIMASVREFIMQAKATAYYGPGFMHALNQMKIPREFFRAIRGFRLGGAVDGFNRSMSVQRFAGGGSVKPLAPANAGLSGKLVRVDLQYGPSRNEVARMISEDSAIDKLARFSVGLALTKA